MNKQIEQLFKRHYRKMYLLAKVLLRDGDAAKDAVSDVFADMLDNNATVDPETAEADACKMEHDISQQTFEAICRHAGRAE